MWFKVKISRDLMDEHGKQKHVIETYLTDSLNFADAGYKVITAVSEDIEVEDVQLLKTFKPSANEQTDDSQIIFVVKVAEDFTQEDGTIKTLKYPVPIFAKNNDDLQIILKGYLSQGMESMRVTTISETKWKYIK